MPKATRRSKRSVEPGQPSREELKGRYGDKPLLKERGGKGCAKERRLPHRPGNHTKMVATKAVPRTRSELLAVAAQAKKGIRAPATPKEHQLAEELARSTEKSKYAQSRLDLASAVANQTKDTDGATYSWALSMYTAV